MKILTVVGARPQFIKAAAISRALQNAASVGLSGLTEVIVHTGQHYDANMSAVFFEELQIPRPKYNLAISAMSHGAMTGRMLEALERVVDDERPDIVLVYGDTNSTLAGTLAAVKRHVPVAHVEAGLRSGNLRMPEEINRIVADRLSVLRFCPTAVAAANLRAEGVTCGVHVVGDVMYDISLFYRDVAASRSAILQRLGLAAGQYALATCHREENTSDRARLEEILAGLSAVAESMPVVLPLHPRTRKVISEYGLDALLASLILTAPLSFLDMVRLEQSARVIITDSGGVQKEAYFYGVPCVTMRDETEWTETVEAGWNALSGANRERVARLALTACRPTSAPALYGNGDAANRIIALLLHRDGVTVDATGATIAEPAR